jgi:hypothetical protein
VDPWSASAIACPNRVSRGYYVFLKAIYLIHHAMPPLGRGGMDIAVQVKGNGKIVK